LGLVQEGLGLNLGSALNHSNTMSKAPKAHQKVSLKSVEVSKSSSKVEQF
jgi:hypothetical protein